MVGVREFGVGGRAGGGGSGGGQGGCQEVAALRQREPWLHEDFRCPIWRGAETAYLARMGRGAFQLSWEMRGLLPLSSSRRSSLGGGGVPRGWRKSLGPEEAANDVVSQVACARISWCMLACFSPSVFFLHDSLTSASVRLSSGL